jgi:hypothetical protein
MSRVLIRLATVLDASDVSDVYLESRKIFLRFAPLAHSDDSVRKWVAGHLIPCERGDLTPPRWYALSRFVR